MSLPTPTTLTFPKPRLTKINGKPTNSSLKLLNRELYNNARAIASVQGGGQHGHLGLILNDAEYLALTGTSFILPVHPGNAPNLPPNATGNQITEANRLYNAQLHELAVANVFRSAVKQQILEAIDHEYLAKIEDPDYGFADVTIPAMLAHLHKRYGKITRAELETNRASIQTCWNIDEPIERLWIRLAEIQRLAEEGNDKIHDNTLIELTLDMFETTGVFGTAHEAWRVKADVDKTKENFIDHFDSAYAERNRQLKLKQCGYHGFNAATANLNQNDNIALAAATPTPAPAPPATTPNILINDGTRAYYCWSHGLGTNPNHTSATCNRKLPGHRDDATFSNHYGGSTTIMRPRNNCS